MPPVAKRAPAKKKATPKAEHNGRTTEPAPPEPPLEEPVAVAPEAPMTWQQGLEVLDQLRQRAIIPGSTLQDHVLIANALQSVEAQCRKADLPRAARRRAARGGT